MNCIQPKYFIKHILDVDVRKYLVQIRFKNIYLSIYLHVRKKKKKNSEREQWCLSLSQYMYIFSFTQKVESCIIHSRKKEDFISMSFYEINQMCLCFIFTWLRSHVIGVLYIKYAINLSDVFSLYIFNWLQFGHR